MFTTKKDIEERIASDRNVLRHPTSAPIPEKNEKTKENQDPSTPKPRTTKVKAPTVPMTTKKEELDRILGLAEASRAMVSSPDRKSPVIQAAIAEAALLVGPKVTSQMFEVSEGCAADLKSKLTDPGKMASVGLQRELEQVRLRLGMLASDRLEKALNCLTDDKLSKIKNATNVARVAKDMATILDKLAPVEEQQEGSIHFHLYKPESVQDGHYDTVVVGAQLPVIDVDPEIPGPR